MCDRVSLLLMLDGLDAGLAAKGDGSSSTPGAVTSVLDWVEALYRAGTDAQAETFARQLTELPWERVRTLPVDHQSKPEANRNRTVGVVVTRIKSEELLQAPAAHGRPDELLLMALMKALATWCDTDVALVDVLGHGRRLPVGVDVSRSVGMFLTYSPVLLDVVAGARPDRLLGQLRRQLDRAWRSDLVRYYGADEIAAPVRALPPAQVLFNYVGRTIAADAEAGLAAADEDRGPESDPGGRRDHQLAVKAELLDDDTFELSFVYSSAVHDGPTIEHLAKLAREALLELTGESSA